MIQYMASIIERIMQYISPAEVLTGKTKCNRISLERLNKICFAAEEHMTEPAIEKKLEYLADWVAGVLKETGHKPDIQKYIGNQISFFDLIECFSEKTLTFSDGEVVYRYEYMEPWHKLSARVGEDMLIANAYAFHDLKTGIQRDAFDWKAVLSHDNFSLNNILNKGVSDNHYHLRGSAPYFDLSWISLMNSVIQLNVIRHLNEMEDNSRNIRKMYVTETQNEGFEILHLKAVLLRIFLYTTLTDKLVQLSDYNVSINWLLEHILESENPGQYLNGISLYEMKQDNDLGISIENCLERQFCDNNENNERNYAERFKEACPGFYWFFWEQFPGIPLNILTNKDALICRENIETISSYVQKYYAELPLRNCEWLFTGRHYEKYRTEWKYQTREELRRLLAEPDNLIKARKYIQSILTGLQKDGENQYKDYILAETASQKKEQWKNPVVSGERWFLYMMYYNRYCPVRRGLGDKDEIYKWFFAYLLIKERFRMELLYNNEKIGFSNFHAYQRRKTWFTTSFSEGDLARTAVRNAFRDAKLKSLELRIMPSDTCDGNIETIQKYDRAIRENWKRKYFDKYYYVFHFSKEKDREICRENSMKCRHEKFRKKLRMKTNAIMWMRERNHETGKRLLGIDACSSEDGCRPEVFAVAFRVLKNHVVERGVFNDKMPQLRLSYHVGEDNQDVLDGLRAIDEAVYFLDMGSGDRLGHATMLGVDALDWYYKNDYTISIHQQDYLDNVVWLYQMMIHYHLPNEDDLLEYLERQYCDYFEKIYRDALDKEYGESGTKEFDIHNYYTAWELRGDNPELYATGEYRQPSYGISAWDDFGIRKKVSNEKREMKKAVMLYHAYHYSARVRQNGSKSIVEKVPLHMIRGIQAVQKKMMRKIARKGIFIETNPTSNVLIGGLDSYGNHPIVNFYNKGLTNDQAELDGCSQINVSINTDDLGVFMTSLSKEYSLMAKALETMSDKNGNNVYKKDMVYDWLNRVRKMGNEQSFREKADKDCTM